MATGPSEETYPKTRTCLPLLMLYQSAFWHLAPIPAEVQKRLYQEERRLCFQWAYAKNDQ